MSDDKTMDDLRHSYCSFCASHDIEILRTIQVKCKKCGKTRLMQQHIENEKR